MDYKSQCGQDQWILENIFHNMQYGFFVDVGAGNGELLSNTWVMEKEFRWEGICIEPHPESFAQLKEKRACALSDRVVMDYNGEVDFHQFSHTAGFSEYFSSITTPQLKNPFQTIRKPCETLFTILEKLRCPSLIHYMSVDTEDSENLILKKFFEEEEANKGFLRHRIITLSVERHTPAQAKELLELMTKYNYTRIATLFIDDIYLHNAYNVLWQGNI